jgi:Condensation domain
MRDLHLDTVSSGPLSYSEERFWQEFGADRQTFIKRGTLLEVPLDEDVSTETLRVLLDTITERHENLRTTYETVDGVPVRKVLPSYHHEIIACDKVPYPFDGENPDHLTPYDLSRFWLTRKPQGSRMFYLDLKEMIADMGSGARLSAEVEQYLGRSPGRPVGPPGATYTEYAIEQRQEAMPEATERFWRETLEGMPPQSAISDDGPDPSGDIAGERAMMLPDQGTAGFRDFCRRHRISSFMAVDALVRIALSALWGADDVTLVTAASTRPGKYENVLGNFGNNVLLRSRLAPGTTLAGAAEAARGTVLSALRHPAQLGKIAEMVPGLEVPPVRIHFLATTSHQHNHMLDSKPTGATWKEAARFPGWTLEVGFAEDSRKRVAIWTQYDPRRFHHARIEKLMNALYTLLLEACAEGNDAADAAWVQRRLASGLPLSSWEYGTRPAA